MKKYTLLLVVFLFCFSFYQAQSVKWVSLEQAEKIQKKYPEKPIFVKFYTDWCGWCKKMDKTTLADPEIVNLINKNYIPVSFNAESPEIYSFRGKEFRFIGDGRTGMNSFAYWTLNGERSYPSVGVIFKESAGKKIRQGFMTKNELLSFLN